MYRFSLGKTTTGSNLATLSPGSAGGTYSTSLVPGTEYRIQFDKSNDSLIYVTTGALRTNGYRGVSGTIEADRLCASGSDFKLSTVPDEVAATFANVSCYELAWNNPLINEPKGWDSLTINIVRDEKINGLITKFTSNLTFWGDGYAFLKNILDTSGYCQSVPVLIEERCSELDEWEVFFEGSIDMSEVELDLQNCEIKTEIKDMGASEMLSKNKNTRVSVIRSFAPSWFVASDYPNYSLLLHDNAGAHSSFGSPYLTAYGYFQYIIAQISDGGMLFESDFYSSATWERLMIAGGRIQSFVSPGRSYGNRPISFDELFSELDKYHNLSFSITYNGRIPTLRIEPKPYFEDAAALTLTNVSNLKYTINKESLYKTVVVGNRRDFNTNENKGMQYISDFGCAGNELNLLSDWIVDSDILYGVLDNSLISVYKEDIILVEAEPHAPAPTTVSQSIVYSGNTYNELLQPELSMERRIESLNATIYRNAESTSVITNPNTPKTKEYEFEYPLTKAQFALITSPSQAITFSGAGLETPTSGIILDIEYNNLTGVTKFKLLAE